MTEKLVGLWQAPVAIVPQEGVSLPRATVRGEAGARPWPSGGVGGLLEAPDGQVNGGSRRSSGCFARCVLLFHPDRRPAGRRRPGRAVAAVGWRGWPPEVVAACESPPRRPRGLGVAAPSGLGDRGWASDIQGEPFVSARRTRGHAQGPSGLRGRGPQQPGCPRAEGERPFYTGKKTVSAPEESSDTWTCL